MTCRSFSPSHTYLMWSAWLLFCICVPPFYEAKSFGISNQNRAMFEACYAEWTKDQLIIGNSHVERRWRIDNGLLYPTSFRDARTKSEWLARPATRPAPYPRLPLPDEPRSVRFSASTARLKPTQADSLNVMMEAVGKSVTLQYGFQIFPAARVVVVQLTTIGGKTLARQPEAENAARETTTRTTNKQPDVLIDTLEDLEFVSPHLRHPAVSRTPSSKHDGYRTSNV